MLERAPTLSGMPAERLHSEDFTMTRTLAERQLRKIRVVRTRKMKYGIVALATDGSGVFSVVGKISNILYPDTKHGC